MAERPILFSGSMVRAILEGKKTQTRRVVRGDVEDVGPPGWYARRRLVHRPTCQSAHCESVDDGELACGGWDCDRSGSATRSPYGRAMDLLWVKETFAPRCADAERFGTEEIIYRADGGLLSEPRWKPSIFMPRWASRITLEVAGVRVERLQDISEEDAEAEGCASGLESVSARWRYEALWSEINGDDSWNTNPWVWVVEFERTARKAVAA